MNPLQVYGWNEELFRQKQNSNYKDFLRGQLTATHKTCQEIVSETGHYACELTENMLYGSEVSEYLGTGDWVLQEAF